MSYFDIHGYEPRWLNGLSTISAAHDARLRALIGHELRHVWLLWDLDDDEWFADGPVLLDFGHEQVEINHQKFDDLSLTWNTVDPRRHAAWTSGTFQLAWRHDARAELVALEGQHLQSVELLEYAGGDMADGMVAVSFVFPSERVAVSNGLDENSLELGEPAPGYRGARSTEPWTHAGDSVTDVVEFLRARIDAGHLETWLTSESGRSLAFVTNTERAMVMLLDGEGDPGEHATDPGAEGESDGYELSNGQSDEYPDAHTVPLDQALRIAGHVVRTGTWPADAHHVSDR